MEDDGAGIPPQDVPRVFERLYTSRPAPGRTFGTGIGLAIVRELAAAMGGTARVDTSDAAGTRFVVALPVANPPAAAQQRPSSSAQPARRRQPDGRSRAVARPPSQRSSTTAGGSTSWRT